MTFNFDSFCELVRSRRTTKIVGDPQVPLSISPEVAERGDALVRSAVAAAGWAPFHFARQAGGLAEPWRVAILWHQACRQLAAEFGRLFTDVKPGNKIPGMLSACGATLLITELPNTAEEIPDENKLAQVNFEHTLAVGGMIQTLLLCLTAAGLATYWSSGGQLGSTTFLSLLGTPADQPTTAPAHLGTPSYARLAGAVFVGYSGVDSSGCEHLSGGNRSKRQPAHSWTREFHQLPF